MHELNQIQLADILTLMEAKCYRVFDDPLGYDLNIVGIRTADMAANTFNDLITVFYFFDSRWVFFAFPATTDPGLYYRQHPVNVKGTAVMKPGQYPGAYMVGQHRGYSALQQKGPITVYRDANQDTTIDTTGTEDSGHHAVNIHRAGQHRASVQVDKWSAGCQVFQDPLHFDFFLEMCRRGADVFGNSFTYTLLDARQLPLKRRTA